MNSILSMFINFFFLSQIRDMLLPGQTAFDRPDIVTRVFHQRLEAFLANLRAGKYFGTHRVVYILRVIEYQHRGEFNLFLPNHLNNFLFYISIM